jgi:flavin reductase (DIM6/NTAB) family NADH-FMN oxidoreductase RutF
MKQVYAGNLLSPLPVALVGALVDGRPNFLVIGYIAPFDFGRYIFFSLYKQRYTRIGIHEQGAFSVNIPSEDLLAETELCGSQSGRDVDKATLFDVFYGELGTAPMIRQCPLSIECEVAQVLDYGQNEGIIGRVVASYADPSCLPGGQLDMRRVRPILWASGGDGRFYGLGERLSD